MCLEANNLPETEELFDMSCVEDIEIGDLPEPALAIILCPVYHFTGGRIQGNKLTVLKRHFNVSTVFDQVVKLAFPQISSRVRPLVDRNMTKYLTSIRQGTNLFFFLRVCIVGVLLKKPESALLNITCAKVVDALLEWTRPGEEKDDLRQENLVNCYTDSISVIDRRGFQLHYSHAFIERLNAAMCMGRR